MPEHGAFDHCEWAVAEQALAGQPESGDRSLVAPRPHGTLFAVVDGLGHGLPAAAAAGKALATLSAHVDDPVVTLVERCHRALRHTRGAVMAVALLRTDGWMRWTGVGNVQAVVAHEDGRAREHAVVLGGVVGMQIPRVRATEVALGPGDALVLATDGISRSFLDDLAAGPARRTAEDILRRHTTGRDDALVLVARYREDRR